MLAASGSTPVVPIRSAGDLVRRAVRRRRVDAYRRGDPLLGEIVFGA
jgi:hypothetical protein